MSVMDTLNRLCKWRAHFAGWMLGTRSKDDPQSQAVRDLFERTILLRAEYTAVLKILLDKGICTSEEFDAALETEAEALMVMYEERWPGVRATDDGLAYDATEIQRAGWMRNWLP